MTMLSSSPPYPQGTIDCKKDKTIYSPLPLKRIRMDKKEAIKELCDYFNATEFEKKRIERIIEGIDFEPLVVTVVEKTPPEVVVRTVYLEKGTVKKKKLSLEDVERITMEKFNIEFGHIKKKNRRPEYLRPRVFFVRYAMRYRDAYGQVSEIGDYLGQDHTSVLHAAYWSKVDCGIERLPATREIRYKGPKNPHG
jgi:hypothetical protein